LCLPSNKLIFEEEVVAENPKEKIVQIWNETHLEITKNDELKMNDSGLNALMEMIKSSQNKPITEKVESLIQVFSNNQINNKKINLDNKTKNELLMRLREEFLKEKENIEEEVKHNKLNKSKVSNNSKFNAKNSNMTSEIEFNITNPFTKNVVDGSGTPNDTNVGFANKGWGVNSNIKSKGNTKTSSVDKIDQKREIRKDNVVVKKQKNTKTPVKKGNKFREDERGYENNFWLGDQIKDEDDDSDEWMVIK